MTGRENAAFKLTSSGSPHPTLSNNEVKTNDLNYHSIHGANNHAQDLNTVAALTLVKPIYYESQKVQSVCTKMTIFHHPIFYLLFTKLEQYQGLITFYHK